jgi:hypothetical protein
MIGCGSLGSKIALHLARNGNNPFHCVDTDFFSPHNNARHALSFTYPEYKSILLAQSIQNLTATIPKADINSATDIDYSHSRIIIETTASFAVRNFLLESENLPRIVSAGLYNKGKNGFLIIESKDKEIKLIHAWAYLYYLSLSNNLLHKVLFDSNLENVNIGQSCSSKTMIVSDAEISLMASVMAIKIQTLLDMDNSKDAEILFYDYCDDNLSTEKLSIPLFTKLPAKNGWKIFISAALIEEMQKLLNEKSPNETGGVLIGTVFLYSQTVVITGILPPPADSVESKNLFVLGQQDLYKSIQTIEQKTHSKITYLGTWHTHPFGGAPSVIDKSTHDSLLAKRHFKEIERQSIRKESICTFKNSPITNLFIGN